MENSKYKTKIENGPVEEQQLAIIHIPSTLHSIDANHIVTTSDEIYDMILKKRQLEINEEQALINAEQKRLNEEIDVFIKDYSLFKKQQNSFNSEQEAFNDGQKIINIEQNDFNEKQISFNKTQKKLNDKQEELNEKQRILNDKQIYINRNVRLDIDTLKLNMVSASGDLDAIKEVLKDYMTESDLDRAIEILKENFEKTLTGYYTKEEVDDAIENAEVDLSDYYTKKEVDNAIENVEVDLTGYYTKEEVDNKFLELDIEKMLNNVSTSLNISPGGAFETGTESQITIKYTVHNFTLSDKSLLSLTMKKGGTIVATGTGETVSYSDKISKSTSYSATCVYKNGVKSWSSSASKHSYYRTYYGFGLSEEDVFANGHSKITSSAGGTYSEVSNADNVYYYIIVPSGVSCPSIFTMNATPFVMNKSSLTKNNITYTILKSGSDFSVGGEVNINAQ